MTEKNTKKIEKKDNSLMPLSEAAKLSGYTPEHLNLLSRKGVLNSQKIGRNWHITLAALNDYLVSINRDPIRTADEVLDSIDAIEETGGKEDGRADEVFDILPSEHFDTDGRSEKEVDDVFESYETDKPALGRVWAGAFSMLIIVPLVFFFSTSAKHVMEKIERAKIEAMADSLPENVIENESSSGEVMGEEDENGISTAYASENFRITQVSLGGQGIALGEENNNQLELTDVKSESFISGKKGTAKLIVSWKTNKPAMSSLTYAKNNGQNSKTVSEDSYGYIHSAVVADLDPRTSYVYTVKTKDRWGNNADSDFFGVYTASKPESVFDLIAGALAEVFGWAMN